MPKFKPEHVFQQSHLNQPTHSSLPIHSSFHASLLPISNLNSSSQSNTPNLNLLRSGTHSSIFRRLRRCVRFEINFYRSHLLAFIFVPFIFAIIFYFADFIDPAQAQRPAFIDCLFMCHSAMTMTGLNTIPLSTLNRLQQALLYILMSIGSTTMISMIMIYIRLKAFKQRFKAIINTPAPLVISRPIFPNGTPPQLQSREKSPTRDHIRGPLPSRFDSAKDLQTSQAQVRTPLEKSNPLEANGFSSNPLAWPEDKIATLPPTILSSIPPHLESLHEYRLDTIPLVASPESSLPPVPRPVLPAEIPQKPILVRRNSDGGVVGAHSMDLDMGPHLESSQLRSNTLLSILKSKPTILTKLALEKSTRQNTRANQLFPRSTTLDQTATFPRNSLHLSHARNRSLAFALQTTPEHVDHQPMPTRGRSLLRTMLGDGIQTSSPSPRDPIHPNQPDYHPLQPGQLGYIAGTDPELISPPTEAQTFHQSKMNGVSNAEHYADGLRRRIKPTTSISAFSGTQHHRRPSGSVPPASQRHYPRQHSISAHSGLGQSTRRRPSSIGLPRTSSTTDFGGFPNPLFVLLKRLGKFLRGPPKDSKHSLEFVRTSSVAAPAFDQKEKHKLTEWLFGTGTGMISERIREVKTVSYIKFNAIVGRNSNFLTLTSAQEEELGGLEYRALSMLLKVVIGYWILFQVIAILILIPYLETPVGKQRFPEVFDAPGGTSRTWYAIWITCSAFTNGGMSLIDAGFTVFHGGYLLMLVCSALIVAGNTGFPIILRAIIWTLSKICRESTLEEHRKVGGGRKEVLNFLLDHPRRCFIYLFPSRQTWYLVFILVALTFIDWSFFLILDVGNPKIESIPIGTRIIVGLLQSLSVRAAGFSTISLGDLAPAVQVLFTIMMYIAVYPIAISIRTTNVYEERSLGIFDLDEELDEESEDDSEEEYRDEARGGRWTSPTEHALSLEAHPDISPEETPNSNISLRNNKTHKSHPISDGLHRRNSSRQTHPKTEARDRESLRSNRKNTSGYLALHLRKQLAFDIWWLALAVWCICIAERNNIVKAQTIDTPSFSIFSIMFEVVSAYGTIGLSVGLPDSSTSMVGGFSTFSKLVVIAVMLRGRHRGLPIAIDRAVILPYDTKSKPHDEDDEDYSHEHSRPDQADRPAQRALSVDEIQELDPHQAFARNPHDLESQ